MLKQCPTCDKTTGMELINRPEEFEIKGQKIMVEVSLYHCKECDSEFSTKELGDPFKNAYDLFREKNGMVQPQQIIEFRKKYDLTQKELSDLLGFGGVTLSRYENGSLQDQAHDNVLKLSMEPHNFLLLLNRNQTAIEEGKKNKIIQQIRQELSLMHKIDGILHNKQLDEFNGYQTFDPTKLAEIIKYICFNKNIFKTKLLKILFYSDFFHYKENGLSISGLRYAKLPRGPVPNDYELILGVVQTLDKSIQMEPVDLGDYSGEKVKVLTPPSKNILSDSEMEIIQKINEKFETFTSTELSDFSHKEEAYIETEPSKLISYKFASRMSLDLS
ncbi:MAG: DUF4065 domain-containing protein [Chloroflexi bacterium]|nr:DUF4065 domain-containing protein [Chloroflexota bacterium]